MGNINNYNFNRIDLRLSNNEYWDLFLNTDDSGSASSCSGLTSGTCAVVWYDFNNIEIYSSSATSATTIYSLVSWDNAVNTGYTFNTIGLTGIDNGLITFDKQSGDTTNQALLSALTGTTLFIPSGDTRLVMNRITGTTGNFVYPIENITGTATTVGNYSQLCGGFYQGYYKLDGSTYEVLPNRVSDAWSAEFWLNPQDICVINTGQTLNDLYPENKGIFFYMGTRAENKFWNQFDGADTGCTSACTTTTACTDTISAWCTVEKESNVSIIGDYGIPIPLDPPQVTTELITNNFLIYGRARDESPARLTGDSGTLVYNTGETSTSQVCHACGGSHDGLGTKTICTYDGNGVVVIRTPEHVTNNQNPFLVYGRGRGYVLTGDTCCQGPNDGLAGETAYSFSGFTSPITEIDYNLDIIDNALAFRIKDDGSIGYRLLTVTGSCSGETYHSGTSIEEGYSVSGVVSADTWSYIAIRFVMPYMDECDLKYSKPRKGKLMFYVNGKLKYTVNEFDEVVGRRLNEYKSKQVGVPFNLSIGGGSQGLIESMTFDGQDQNDFNLPIQENFAGTFIGGISQFKFNICDLGFCDIEYNFKKDANRYGIIIPNHGHC